MTRWRNIYGNRLRAHSDASRLLNLLLFVIITLGIHFLFRWWAYDHEYRVFGVQLISMDMLQQMGHFVFSNARWLVMDVLGIQAHTVGQIIYMPDGGGVAVDGACSGLKQMLQFALLILLLPGPWKHKGWYIPLGIIIMHIVNVFRVFGLCMVMWWDPSKFEVFHNYIFRPFFYVVIFVLWVVWTELLRPRRHTP